MDDAQSTFDQAIAQLAARRATVQEVTQQLDTAIEDLGDAVLFAPFSGRITQVYISKGAVVKAGIGIALTLRPKTRPKDSIMSSIVNERGPVGW